MKRLFLALLYLPTFIHAQNSFPTYTEVVTEFYKHYAFSKELLPDGVNFARMKDGWHCQVINQLTEEVKTDELFWDAEYNSYLNLASYSGPDDLEAEDNVTAAMEGTSAGNYYCFDRCRYYGYNHWTEDMIRDYGPGDKHTYSDTLLEGLARAYSGYGSKFLWYQYGGGYMGDETDSLKRRLHSLETPSRQRIDSVNYYLGKAIETYKILATRNPGYILNLGNSSMKLFNEQMNGYMQMMLAGYNDLAQSYLSQIQPNSVLKAIGHNYLNNCPPNTILFTFGDNDTYPLWFVQEAENFRKDVSVINVSLLGLPVYVDMLKKTHQVNFTTSSKIYSDRAFVYFWKDGKGKPNSSLAEFIKIIQDKTYPHETEFYGTMATYPQNQLLFNIDLAQFRKINAQQNLQPHVKIDLPDYITSDQLLTLDIINSNLYNRPVCFSSIHELLSKYLQMNGLVYQFLPLDSAKVTLNQRMSALRTRDFLLRTFKPTPSNDLSSGLVADYILDGLIYDMYFNVAEYYVEKNKKDSGQYFIDQLFRIYGGRLPFAMNKNRIAATLMDLGRDSLGTQMMIDYAETLYNLHKHPRTPYPYISRKKALNSIIDIQALFATNGRDRTPFDKLVTLLNREDH